MVHHFGLLLFILTCFQFLSNLLCLDYCLENKHHVLCDDKSNLDNLCAKSAILHILDEQQQSDVLSILNYQRSNFTKTVLPGGKAKNVGNMMQLEWDPELARSAAAIAMNCAKFEPCQGCVDLERFPSAFARTNEKRRGRNEAMPFRVQKYIYSLLSLRKQHSIKHLMTHFQQTRDSITPFGYLMRPEIYLIGCGLAIHSEGQRSRHSFVCSLGPVGPSENGSLYLSGKPCSFCPRGSRCSELYNFLCVCETNCFPFEHFHNIQKRQDSEDTLMRNDTGEGAAPPPTIAVDTTTAKGPIGTEFPDMKFPGPDEAITEGAIKTVIAAEKKDKKSGAGSRLVGGILHHVVYLSISLLIASPLN